MRRKTTKEFIEECRLVHGDKYDYSLVDYIGGKKNVDVICPNHGIFKQWAYAHMKGGNCPTCNNVNTSNRRKSTHGEFIKRAIEIHGEKYDYTKTNYIDSNTKVIIICPEHGEFKQRPANHIRGYNCPKCVGCFMDKEYFIDKSIEIHGEKYDYSLVEYEKAHTKVKIICPEHGVFEQEPTKHTLRGHGCPVCNESKGEREIREYLSENNINFKSQKRFKDCKNIKPLPFDFYLPDYNICIEYDGRQHYEPVEYFGGVKGLIETQKRDKIKTDYCEINNINLVRIRYGKDIINQVIEKYLGVKPIINSFRVC